MSRFCFATYITPNRLGVLLANKRDIQDQLRSVFAATVEIDVDSLTGNVTISFESESEHVIADKIGKLLDAIALGFAPSKALQLCHDDIQLYTYNLHECISRKHARHLRLVKGRIIGTDGSCRRKVEELSGTYLSLYGSEVAIIGKREGCEVALNAVKMLAQGKAHMQVYQYLQHYKSETRWKRIITEGQDED